eukprot:scaffold12920_cov22-Tisochrysis_lutea.AAC.3
MDFNPCIQIAAPPYVQRLCAWCNGWDASVFCKSLPTFKACSQIVAPPYVWKWRAWSTGFSALLESNGFGI